MGVLLVGVEDVVPTVVIGDAVEEMICLTRMFRDLATLRSSLDLKAQGKFPREILPSTLLKDL